MDIRKIILNRLEELDWSRGKLVAAVAGKAPPASVYDFLRGVSTLNSKHLGLLCEALGLSLVATKQPATPISQATGEPVRAKGTADADERSPRVKKQDKERSWKAKLEREIDEDHARHRNRPVTVEILGKVKDKAVKAGHTPYVVDPAEEKEDDERRHDAGRRSLNRLDVEPTVTRPKAKLIHRAKRRGT